MTNTTNCGRRRFLKRVAGAVVAAPVLMRSATAMAKGAGKWNVILIVADDQRHDTIAAMGNKHISTPNLDVLVRDGFTFNQARCMGSQVAAVCVPSRAQLHTGRTLFRVPLDMGQYPTLGQTLQGAGFNAFAFGKWHNETPSFARSFNGGGNIFFGGMERDQYRVHVHQYDPSGQYRAQPVVTPGKFSSELFTDAAVEFLEMQKDAVKPFFCYLALTSPHDPRTPPPPFKTMYDPAAMPLPANFLPEHPFDNGELKIRDERLAPFPRTPENTRQQLCDYYGMVSSQDAQVGRVLAALQHSGQAEKTIVIYTGDHGLAIGSHGLFGKQNVYEHSARIPLVITGPGIARGMQSDALVYGFDLFPTLCRWLNVAVPDSVEGISLADIVAGNAKEVRDSSFHAYIHQNPTAPNATQHAVNDGRWKLIRYDVANKTRLQLFDLKNDPDEIHDLSSDPTAMAEMPRLQNLLSTWQSKLAEPPEFSNTAARA